MIHRALRVVIYLCSYYSIPLTESTPLNLNAWQHAYAQLVVLHACFHNDMPPQVDMVVKPHHLDIRENSRRCGKLISLPLWHGGLCVWLPRGLSTPVVMSHRKKSHFSMKARHPALC